MIIINYHGQQDDHQMLLLFLECMLILSLKSQDLIFSFKKRIKMLSDPKMSFYSIIPSANSQYRYFLSHGIEYIPGGSSVRKFLLILIHC